MWWRIIVVVMCVKLWVSPIRKSQLLLSARYQSWRNLFSRVLINCVGPLPKSKKGNEYLLTIMDVSTRFPEVPLRSIKSTGIVAALLHFFSRVGLPLEIQHDRRSNFTSSVFQEVMLELGIGTGNVLCLSSSVAGCD